MGKIHELSKCCLDLTKLTFREKQLLMNKTNKSLKIGYNYLKLHGQCTYEYVVKNNLKEVDLKHWINNI